MPEASELEGYKHVDPTLPDRIMQMAEREAAHRHAMDQAAMEQRGYSLRSNTTLQQRGLFCGLGIILIAFAAAIYFFATGNVAAGIAFCSTPVLGIAVAMFKVSRNHEKDTATDDGGKK